MYQFITKIKSATVYNPQAHYNIAGVIDIDDITASAEISYELEPDVREWGIDSISVFIKGVECSVEWETSTEGLTPEQVAAYVAAGAYVRRDDVLCGTINLSITEDHLDKEWSLDKDDLDFDADGAFDIDCIEIDFKDKHIILY